MEKKQEPDVLYATSVQPVSNDPNANAANANPYGKSPNTNAEGVPPGHGRYYCEKCGLSYDLPNGATSWRCTGCHTFNTTTPPECPCCTIQ